MSYVFVNACLCCRKYVYRREEECKRKGRVVGERSQRGKEERLQSQQEHGLHINARMLVVVRFRFKSQLNHVVAV